MNPNANGPNEMQTRCASVCARARATIQFPLSFFHSNMAASQPAPACSCSGLCLWRRLFMAILHQSAARDHHSGPALALFVVCRWREQTSAVAAAAVDVIDPSRLVKPPFARGLLQKAVITRCRLMAAASRLLPAEGSINSTVVVVVVVARCYLSRAAPKLKN